MPPPSHGRAPQPCSLLWDTALELQPCSHSLSWGYAFALGGAPRKGAHPRHWGDKQGSRGFAPG